MQATQEIPRLLTPGILTSALSASPDVKPSASQFLARAYKIVDLVIVIGSVFGAWLLTNVGALPGHAFGFLALRVSIKNLLLVSLFGLACSLIYRGFGLYRYRRLNWSATGRVFAATTLASSLSVVFVLTSRGNFPFNTVFLVWLIALCLTLAARIFLHTVTGPAISSKHPRHILIVGSGWRAQRLCRNLNSRAGADYCVLGFVDDAPGRQLSPEIQNRMLGGLAQLEEILVGNVVDEVLITLPVKSFYTQIQDALLTCERVGVESKYLSQIFRGSLSKADQEDREGVAVTALNPVVDDERLILKRAIDIAGSFVGLVTLAPLFLVIAFAIKLTGDGPVIFSQERHGRNRRRFKMYKFRTMVHEAEALQPFLETRNEVDGPVFKIRNDPRVTRVGTILRRTSLDELPQLLNVLKGEMSLVGPRPLPARDVSRFEEGWLMRRFCVVPGLTGLWQVNGRSSAGFQDWISQDFHYIDNWSLRLDLQILARTIPAVLKGGGAA